MSRPCTHCQRQIPRAKLSDGTWVHYVDNDGAVSLVLCADDPEPLPIQPSSTRQLVLAWLVAAVAIGGCLAVAKYEGWI